MINVDLASNNSGSSSPRSRNTLPEDSSNSIAGFLFTFPLFIFVLRDSQPFANEFHDVGGRFASLLGLLLKDQQHADKLLESNRVNRAIRIAVVIGADFQNACSTETLEHLASGGVPPFCTSHNAWPIFPRAVLGSACNCCLDDTLHR